MQRPPCWQAFSEHWIGSHSSLPTAPGPAVLILVGHSRQVSWPDRGWKKSRGQAAQGARPVSEYCPGEHLAVKKTKTNRFKICTNCVAKGKKRKEKLTSTERFSRCRGLVCERVCRACLTVLKSTSWWLRCVTVARTLQAGNKASRRVGAVTTDGNTFTDVFGAFFTSVRSKRTPDTLPLTVLVLEETSLAGRAGLLVHTSKCSCWAVHCKRQDRK